MLNLNSGESDCIVFGNKTEQRKFLPTWIWEISEILYRLKIFETVYFERRKIVHLCSKLYSDTNENYYFLLASFSST